MRTAFTQQQWDELMVEVRKQIDYLSRVKGGEYAHGDDRLDNFRRNAADVGAPMATIWRVYAGKHWDSITTWVKDIQTGNMNRERSESIEGRFMDLIVYSILGIAIHREHEENEHERRNTGTDWTEYLATGKSAADVLTPAGRDNGDDPQGSSGLSTEARTRP